MKYHVTFVMDTFVVTTTVDDVTRPGTADFNAAQVAATEIESAGAGLTAVTLNLDAVEVLVEVEE